MENQVSSSKFMLNYGLILGLIAVLLSVIGYVAGATEQGAQWPQWIFYLVFAVFIFYSINAFRTKNGGYMSLGQALKVGVGIAIVSGLIAAIYNYVFLTFIDPEIMENLMLAAEDKMIEDNPSMTDEQVEMAMSWARKFANPVLGGAFLVIFSAIFGFIYSLIAGLIWKREAPTN